MSGLPEDPLFAQLRALPRPAPSVRLRHEVQQSALAALASASGTKAPSAMRWLAAGAVALGVLAYFGWAIAFVITTRF